MQHSPHRKRSAARAIAFVAICALGGCATSAPHRTALSNVDAIAIDAACSTRVVDQLHFGLNTPDGTIDRIEWDRFLAAVVTPNFPDGFTTFDAQGQWRGGDGKIVREPSRVVEIIHDGSARDLRAVGSIIDNYKRTYRQESVLLVRTQAQACF